MIFVDTGVFVALYRRQDQYHQEATRIWSNLKPPFIISNHVVDEVATALGRLAGFMFAADCVGNLYASQQFDVLASDRDDELEALRWMRKYADQRVSFTDCVSFALMRRHRIRRAFTFDRHFRLAGYEVVGLK